MAAPASAQRLLPPDTASTIGRAISFEGFEDDGGHDFNALVQAGYADAARPWIISPIYTRCPHTCSAITDALRRAIEQSGLNPSEYRVVSFSFDPGETVQGLQSLRAKMRLPEDWLVLRARDRAALERTLEALDFRTIRLGDGEYDHPNLVAVLAPDMRLAGYLFGVAVSPTALARTVRRARDGVSAVEPWSPLLFLFSTIGFLTSALAFALLLSRRRARRPVPPPAAARVNT